MIRKNNKQNKMTENKLNSYGCENFMGLEVLPDGEERFVALNLHGLGTCNYTSLEIACMVLCAETRRGRKVLLFKSPGNVASENPTGETKYLPFKQEQMKALERMYESKIEMKTLPNPFLNQPE